MLTLKAAGFVFLGIVVVYLLWYLTSALAYFYLLVGSSHPRPGPGFAVVKRLFEPLAKDLERDRQDDVLESADSALRRSWWLLHLVMAVVLGILVLVVRHLLIRGVA